MVNKYLKYKLIYYDLNIIMFYFGRLQHLSIWDVFLGCPYLCIYLLQAHISL